MPLSFCPRRATSTVVDENQADPQTASPAAVVGREPSQSDTRPGWSRSERHKARSLLEHYRGATRQIEIQVLWNSFSFILKLFFNEKYLRKHLHFITILKLQAAFRGQSTCWTSSLRGFREWADNAMNKPFFFLILWPMRFTFQRAALFDFFVFQTCKCTYLLTGNLL